MRNGVARVSAGVKREAGIRLTMSTKENLVVGSKVKARVSEAGMRSDGGLVEALSDKIHELLDEAIERTKQNGRNTVRPHDL